MTKAHLLPILEISHFMRFRNALGTGVLFIALGCGGKSVQDGDLDGPPDEVASGGHGGSEDGSSEEPPRKICDGSERLRFALIENAWGDGAIEPFQVLETELGWKFFYVDGRCRYYTNGTGYPDPQETWGRTREFRQGRLSPEEADELERAFRYDEWDELAGLYSSEDGSYRNPVVLHDTKRSLECRDGCPTSAPWLKLELDEFDGRANAWFERGKPMMSAVRALANKANPRSTALPDKVFEWPLGRSLDDFVLPWDEPEPRGNAPLIEDEDAVAALREIRSEARKQKDFSSRRIVFRVDEESVYEFAFRDTLPFENEAGLIPVPKLPER